MLIDFARQMVIGGLGNYKAGAEQACEIARNPGSNNRNTVVVMVADDKPNRRQTVKNLVQKNCGGGTFQIIAIPNLVDCYAILNKGNVGPTDNRSMLYRFSE